MWEASQSSSTCRLTHVRHGGKTLAGLVFRSENFQQHDIAGTVESSSTETSQVPISSTTPKRVSLWGDSTTVLHQLAPKGTCQRVHFHRVPNGKSMVAPVSTEEDGHTRWLSRPRRWAEHHQDLPSKSYHACDQETRSRNSAEFPRRPRLENVFRWARFIHHSDLVVEILLLLG